MIPAGRGGNIMHNEESPRQNGGGMVDAMRLLREDARVLVS